MPVFSIAIKRLGANSKVSGSRKFFGGRSRCWSATTRASLKLLLATATSCLFWLATAHASGSQIPNYDHVVVVIMSAQQASDVVGSPSAPYINGALIDGGTLLTNSYAVSDVSQQNYWAFLSGYVQNNEVLESCPNSFTAITLASQLTDAGLSFAQYSEGLGSTGSTVCAQGLYTRYHNPVPDFAGLPSSANRDFAGFAGDLAADTLPTVSFVVPDLCNDMHGPSTICSGTESLVALGDAWLEANMPAYLASSSATNGLLIVTWDNPGAVSFASTRIPTIFLGAHVKAGNLSPTTINHYSVLRTIEDMYGLIPLGQAANNSAITDVWDDTIFANGFE